MVIMQFEIFFCVIRTNVISILCNVMLVCYFVASCHNFHEGSHQLDMFPCLNAFLTGVYNELPIASTATAPKSV